VEIFGKSFLDIVPFKKDFFDHNDRLLERTLKIADEYNKQPIRTKCKNCMKDIGRDAPFFEKHKIRYVFCNHCGHCCGDRQETTNFLNFLYFDSQGKDYAETYSEKDSRAYWNRVHSIYTPKVEFLFHNLENIEENPTRLQYTDVGAGSGYFVAALREKGISDAIGYDVSISQARLANEMVGDKAVICINMGELAEILGNIKTSVVSMIGFIEHAQYPHIIMNALAKNVNVKFLLITFPLFSFTVFFERIFEYVMPRHLGGGHTHLYTLQSLNWFEKEYHLATLGKWWFGTDAMDLYRSTVLELNRRNEDNLSVLFQNMFYDCIDGVQQAIDQKLMCSSVHAVYRIN